MPKKQNVNTFNSENLRFFPKKYRLLDGFYLVALIAINFYPWHHKMAIEMPIMQENIYLSTTILQSLVALPPQSSSKLAKYRRTNITVTMSFQRFSRLAVHLTKQFYPWRYSFQSLYSITIALSGNESIMRPHFYSYP